MTMNPFEQSTQQLLRFLTSHAELEVIDYIRQEIQHDAPDSVPTAEELLTFFRSPDTPTELDTYQQKLLAVQKIRSCNMSMRSRRKDSSPQSQPLSRQNPRSKRTAICAIPSGRSMRPLKFFTHVNCLRLNSQQSGGKLIASCPR